MRGEPAKQSPTDRAQTSASNGPRRLAAFLERMGPVYVKIGQNLSLRPDILPQAYCDALLRLTDNVAPLPWHEISRVLAAAFGRPPEQVFAWIDQRPVAAASLSQVHRARTHAGEEVAVKVQRPGIAAQVARDLRTMRRALRLLPPVGEFAVIDRAGFAAEIERWLLEEIDLRREFANTAELYEASGDLYGFRVPRPIPALSGPHVLTMTFFEGVPCSELLRLAAEGRMSQIADLGIDRVAFARNLTRAMLTQVFSAPAFHADPHPGNLIALDGDIAGFVDFGVVDRLDPELRASQMRIVAAVFSGETERILAVLDEVLEPGPGADPEAFGADFRRGLRQWRRDRALRPPGAHGPSPLAGTMVQMMQSARRHRMRVPSDVLSMYRALLAVETIAAALGAEEAGLRDEGGRFFARLQVETALDQLKPAALQPLLGDLFALLRDGPGQATRLLADLADDRFVLRTQVTESPEDRRMANGRARLVAAAILFVGFALLAGRAPDRALAGAVTTHDLALALLALWLGVIAYLWTQLR